MEIKQHLKLSQQLVMTPQLQQAIKLLQLSRMELADVVREEILENPVLEDGGEVGADGAKIDASSIEAAGGAERAGETELPVADSQPDGAPATAEVKADTRDGAAVNEFDWETYLESQSNAAPMPSYKAN